MRNLVVPRLGGDLVYAPTDFLGGHDFLHPAQRSSRNATAIRPTRTVKGLTPLPSKSLAPRQAATPQHQRERVCSCSCGHPRRRRVATPPQARGVRHVGGCSNGHDLPASSYDSRKRESASWSDTRRPGKVPRPCAERRSLPLPSRGLGSGDRPRTSLPQTSRLGSFEERLAKGVRHKVGRRRVTLDRQSTDALPLRVGEPCADQNQLRQDDLPTSLLRVGQTQGVRAARLLRPLHSRYLVRARMPNLLPPA